MCYLSTKLKKGHRMLPNFFKKLTSLFVTKSDSNLEYEKIRAPSDYSPWNLDKEFQRVLSEISGFTLVDKFRCYELWKLVEESAKLQDGHFIEIGVWRGGTGALIAQKVKNLGLSNKVYLCDTFTGIVKTTKFDTSYFGGEHNDTSLVLVKDFIFNKFKLDNVEILEGIFPDQTGNKVKDLKFRFVHVDVDVYQSAKDLVEWIWDKMVPGAIMVYDDYGFSSCSGITKYVNEQRLLKDRLVIHNLNGHAIVIKL